VRCGCWGKMAAGSEAECAAMDAADELGFVRERFVLPDGKVYLDGACPAARILTQTRRVAARCEPHVRSPSSAQTLHRPITVLGGWAAPPRRVFPQATPSAHCPRA
jgi:kynureninase